MERYLLASVVALETWSEPLPFPAATLGTPVRTQLSADPPTAKENSESDYISY